MSVALMLALFFTVIVLITTAYFIMGSVPLLVLRHDTPKDARFVSGFFSNYYLAVMVTASAAALNYGLDGKLPFAAGAIAAAILAALLRKLIIPRMDLLGAHIQSNKENAIRQFRRVHLSAIVIMLAQLVAMVWWLISVSMEMR